VTVHSMTFEDRAIHLIDTPGFDDDGRTDGETIQEIAFWLTKAYEQKVRIGGLVYLHRITDPRLQGSALRALNAFKKLCGPENYYGLVMVTTRWDELAPHQIGLATARQQELSTNDKYWGDIRRAGGKTIALSAARIDALNIIRHILSKNRSLALAFQRQLIEEERPIHLTDAGQILYETSGQHYQQLRDQLSETERELKSLLETHSDQKRQQLRETIAQLSTTMESMEQDRAYMKMRTKTLQDIWNVNLRRELDDIQRASKENEETLHGKRNEIMLLQSDAVRSPTAESRLIYEAEQLERKRNEISIVKKHQLAGRSSRSGIKTAMSVVGTGLAVGQLVAAMACTVM